MQLTLAEINGIREFFESTAIHQSLAVLLAKSLVTKTLPLDTSLDDALNIIFKHMTSVHSIFQKKIIAKETISHYLARKQIAVYPNEVKSSLIDKMLEHWCTTTTATTTTSITNISTTEPVPAHCDTLTTGFAVPSQVPVENYPVNLLAREFSRWFFTKYNENGLSYQDFFADASCDVHLTNNNADNSVQYHEAADALKVIEMLFALRTQLTLYFSPNVSYDGVRGRIDPHGMVIILCCGTVHKADSSIGFFETIFQLVRDPFADNNWKTKRLRFQLKFGNTASNQLNENPPSILQCESLSLLEVLPDTNHEL